MPNAESCQGVICRKSSAERSENYRLSLFRIQQPKNCIFPSIVKVPFTHMVQQMCSVRHPVVPSIFFVVCLPKNSGFYILD